MERKLWRRVDRLVRRLAGEVEAEVEAEVEVEGQSATGATYSDGVVVLAYFWAVLYDRPQAWACERSNWHRGLLKLPSAATLSRRLRTASVKALMQRVEQRLRQRSPPSWVKMVDGKPLTVSRFSKDPDAKFGYAAGGVAKGYKLHAIGGKGAVPDAWEVRPLNEAEPTIACDLVTQLNGEGDLLGDAVLDANKLYEAAAAQHHQMLAPRKNPEAGLGHRRHSPHRLRGIEVMNRPYGETLYQSRGWIEQRFGQLTNLAIGLKPLPNWVRRLPRVRRWVQTKLIINACQLLLTT